jgi:hypothetical protein
MKIPRLSEWLNKNDPGQKLTIKAVDEQVVVYYSQP